MSWRDRGRDDKVSHRSLHGYDGPLARFAGMALPELDDAAVSLALDNLTD